MVTECIPFHLQEGALQDAAESLRESGLNISSTQVHKRGHRHHKVFEESK